MRRVTVMTMKLPTLAIVFLALLGACSGGRPLVVQVGQIPLADADGVVEPEPGPLLELGPRGDEPMPAIPPGAKIVQIAAARDLPYARVAELVQAVNAAGARPVLLVGSRGKVMALPHSIDAIEKSILVEATMDADGAKACMQPPEALERSCTRRSRSPHIDRAFVRELVRDAVKGYGLTHVHVRADAGMSWVDVVRTLDAARTCCKGVVVQISVEGLAI